MLARSDHDRLIALIYRTILRDESITDVADDLHISRSKAHGLLREARRAGFIETLVTFEAPPQEELGYAVRDYWRSSGLERVLVLPGPPDDRTWDDVAYRGHLRRNLGALAARYVASLPLQKHDHLCVGGGRTLISFALRFAPDERQLVVRPLATGGRWHRINHIDASAVVQVLHSRLGFPTGQGVTVLCPEMPPGPVEDMFGRPEYQAVFGMAAPQPAVTVCGISRCYYHPNNASAESDREASTFVQLYAATKFYRSAKGQKWLREDPLRIYERLPAEIYGQASDELKEKGILTDVCRFGITEQGTVVSTILNQTSMAIEPKRLRAWRETTTGHLKSGTNTVIVAGGTRLGPALRAVLRGKFFRTLVTDTAGAIQLLPPEKRPEQYRDILEYSGFEDGVEEKPVVGEALAPGSPPKRKRKPRR